MHDQERPMHTYTVQDIYYHRVTVFCSQGQYYLENRPVQRIHLHNDGTIELQVAVPDTERPLRYFFHGYQYWQLLHPNQEPSQEYAGKLEAKLAYIRQIAATATPVETTIEGTTAHPLLDTRAEGTPGP